MFVRLLAVVLLASLSHAQNVRNAGDQRLPFRQFPPESDGVWYTGDTHEHLQNCDGSLITLSDIRRRMDQEGLNVVSVMIWHTDEHPFTSLACRVTGEVEPLSTPERLLQFTVETSGLDCSEWGHLIGMGVGTEARIARGSVEEGACDEMAGLGLGCAGGDGTGALNGLVAARFQHRRAVVTGYAHSAWTLGTYHPQGFDWTTQLVTSGFTSDVRCLDEGRLLAFPDLDELVGDEHHGERPLHGGGPNTYLPLLGAVDAVLGEAEFFETTFLSADSPVPVSPPANWFGLYYKLLSAGLRVGISGGSDRACPLPGVTEHPQTSVLLKEPLTFDTWSHGVAEGHTTLGPPGLRVELLVGGKDVGSELALTSPDARALARVRVTSTEPLDDSVELVADGEVVAAAPVQLAPGSALDLDFPDVPFPRSTWVAARLASQRAHTAAVYVIVDGRPIVDCEVAEYWMLWCDTVEKLTLERPDLELFGCQEGEALERIERARRAFRTYRDIGGIDPGWGISRYGVSAGACRGPISIGADGPLVGGAPYRLECVQAPPEADGFLYLSFAPDPEGPCIAGARFFVDTSPEVLADFVPVHSSRSGFAEVTLTAPAGGGPLYAQFVWVNPLGCAGSDCGSGRSLVSASDALELVVN